MGVFDEGEGLMMTALKKDQAGTTICLGRARSGLVRPVVSRWQTAAVSVLQPRQSCLTNDWSTAQTVGISSDITVPLRNSGSSL